MNKNSDFIMSPPTIIKEKKTSFIGDAYFLITQKVSSWVFEKACKGEIEGIENLRNINHGFILASNHSSYLDWLVLYSLFKKKINKKIYFLAKEKLFRSSIWQPLINSADCIKVTDLGVSLSSMRRIITILRSDGIVGAFPEGTRSANGTLLKAKDGAAKIAALTGVPIVPVGLIGFYETWPRWKIIPTRFSRCKIKIGHPLYPHDILSSSTTSNFSTITQNVMIAIGELIGQKYTHLNKPIKNP